MRPTAYALALALSSCAPTTASMVAVTDPSSPTAATGSSTANAPGSPTAASAPGAPTVASAAGAATSATGAPTAPPPSPHVALVRESGPRPGGTPTLKAPHPTVTALGGGLDLLVEERHDLPLVEVRVVLPVGSRLDPTARPGLAAFTALALHDGTKTRTHDALVDALATAGGALTVEVSGDHTVLETRALGSELDAALGVLADLVAHPSFPAASVDARRKDTIAERERDESDPGFVAAREAARLMAELPSTSAAEAALRTPRAALEAITREDLVRFAGAYYRPAGAAVIVVGDVAPATLTARVKKAFASWKPTGAPRPLSVGALAPSTTPASTAARAAIHLVPTPPTAEARLLVAWPLPAHLSVGDEAALLVASQAIDQALGAHGVRARLDDDVFIVEQRVASSEAAAQLASLLAVLEALRAGTLSDAELFAAREHIVGAYEVALDRLDGVTRLVESARAAGLAPEHWEGFASRIEKIDAATVAAAVKTRLDPARAIIVVAGDASLQQALSAVAPVAQ